MTSSPISNRSLLLRAEAINSAVEKHFRLYAALFLALFLACAIARDVRTPLWTDEFFTLYMAQQTGVGEIVKATLEGSDGAPPLYSMMVKAILPVVRHQALAVRLPATLGYCGMLVCLLWFCRRRLPAAYSLAAALLTCEACLEYSTEGRGYGVVLGCSAGALLCWQSAVDGRRRVLTLPLLAFCLSLMTAMHYYSIFFLVPLFIGEMARWRTSRKLDFGVLAAMAASVAVLGLHYPFMEAGAKFQKHFWSPAAWRNIPAVYLAYLVPMLIKCVLPAGPLAVLPATSDARSAKPSGLTRPEWIVTGALSLMPICLVVLSKYITHMFLPRYVLWAVPGFAILVAALLCRAAENRVAVGVSLLALLVALAPIGEVTWERPALKYGERVRQALPSLPDGPEPIVVADIHVFMELSYYEASRIRERLIYPVSRELELHYLGSDTTSLLSSALSHRSKLQIIEYDAVLAAHPRFVLAALPDNYLPWHLVETGYSVVPIGSSTVPVLYEVEAPVAAAAGSPQDHPAAVSSLRR
jgi:Dolichyl-phosphate-mannose-protein mannosyltransferase